MDRVFSVEDIADQFWSPPPVRLSQAADLDIDSSASSKVMNRSSSEWAFQRFLQEASANSPAAVAVDQAAAPPSSVAAASPATSSSHSQKPLLSDVAEIQGGRLDANRKSDYGYKSSGNEVETVTATTTAKTTTSVGSGAASDIPIDSEDYQAFLKKRLDLACAAVALTRANYMKAQDSASVPSENASLASHTPQPGPQTPAKVPAHDLPKVQEEEAGGPIGIPSLPAMQKKLVAQVKSTTSGSEQSEDEEAEGEAETTDKTNPAADVKRVRRMLSNRESARRSRRRKQAHLTELETQVSQLRVENSSLLKRLTDISQKYNESAVDNRVLKADVETLRAKVKMAEETVKRATGLNPLFQAMPEIPTMGLPPFAGSPDTSSDASVPVQDDLKHHFYQPPSNSGVPTHNPAMQNGLVDIPPIDDAQQGPTAAAAEAAGANKMGRTASMQRVASLEHLQKRIRGEVGSSERDQKQ